MEKTGFLLAFTILSALNPAAAHAGKRSELDFGIYQNGAALVADRIENRRVFHVSGPFVIGVNKPKVVLCVTQEDLGEVRNTDAGLVSCFSPARTFANSEDATDLIVGPDGNNQLSAGYELKSTAIGRHRYRYTVDSLYSSKEETETPVSLWKNRLHVVVWVDRNGDDDVSDREVEEIVLAFDGK